MEICSSELIEIYFESVRAEWKMFSENKILSSLWIYKSWQNQQKWNWTVSYMFFIELSVHDLLRNKMISDTTKLLKRSLIILWFSRMLVSASGIANRRSTGSESSLVCCPIAKELTFAGFSVYFAQFCRNNSYFSLVLSFFGITLSTNRCELHSLNATVCHLPQTWKKK